MTAIRCVSLCVCARQLVIQVCVPCTPQLTTSPNRYPADLPATVASVCFCFAFIVSHPGSWPLEYQGLIAKQCSVASLPYSSAPSKTHRLHPMMMANGSHLYQFRRNCVAGIFSNYSYLVFDMTIRVHGCSWVIHIDSRSTSSTRHFLAGHFQIQFLAFCPIFILLTKKQPFVFRCHKRFAVQTYLIAF